MDVLALLFAFLLGSAIMGCIVYLAVRIALKKHDKDKNTDSR